MISYVSVQNDAELHGILTLQQQNLASLLSPEQIQNQGFVTVVHSFDLLKKMHAIEPSIIAREEGQVIGYCLAMTYDFKNDIPVLVPMFEIINKLIYKGVPLAETNYIVVGQVCVAEKYRGKGVFAGLYQAYKQTFSKRYRFAVTEIAQRNQRSLYAHKRIGFESIHTYQAEEGEIWEIVIWPLN